MGFCIDGGWVEGRRDLETGRLGDWLRIELPGQLQQLFIPLHHILHILYHKLSHPQKGSVRPALGMEGDHDLLGQFPPDRCPYNIESGMKVVTRPDTLPLHFVPHTAFFRVPPAAGIGKIKNFGEIDIQVGFTDNPKVAVVIMLP